MLTQAADDLEKEVKQLSGLNAHKRIVTYLGACYADHPRFREKCLYVFTEFMPGVNEIHYVIMNFVIMSLKHPKRSISSTSCA